MLKIPQIPIHEKSARTTAEFCARNSISRAMFYKLKNAGKGPRLLRVGTKSLISDQAEKDWLRALEGAEDSPKAA